MAGFFYEFIFNPTRSSSVCYLPKLFRLSAQDMAKVGSKSRLYQQQQQQQKLSPSASGTNGIFQSMANSATSEFRPQTTHHFSTMHHSPSIQHQQTNNLMSSSALLNPTLRDHKQQQQQLIATPTTLAHLQSNQFISNNIDSMNFLQQPSSQQFAIHEATNFDNRSKSIINLMAAKQQQSTINMPQRNGNFHSNSTSNGSNSQDFGKFATSFRGFQDHSQMPFSTASKPAFSEL